MLMRPPCKEHLVVDEGQDLPEEFFKYANQYVANAVDRVRG